MYTSETLQALSERLFRENICTVPLNEKALQTVAEFIRLRNANSELMRRLSNVELNYVQIRAEAEESCHDASLAKDAISDSFRALVDIWGQKGYLREFMFSFKQEAADDMRSDLSFAIEAINANLNVISKSLMTLGETSAQMRACSSSFMPKAFFSAFEIKLSFSLLAFLGSFATLTPARRAAITLPPHI